MGSRDALGTLALVLLSALAWGCRGEFIYDDPSVSGDGDGDATGDGDGDAFNMLGNPSFELWSGEQAAVWDTSDATLTRSDDAVEGEFSGVVTAVTYSSVGQYLNFPDPLLAGTCLRGGASIRWIEGATQAPGFLLNATYEAGGEELLGDQLPWVADGQWYDAQIAQVELPQDVASLAVTIGNTTPDPHTYGVDAAWLRVEPCQ